MIQKSEVHKSIHQLTDKIFNTYKLSNMGTLKSDQVISFQGILNLITQFIVSIKTKVSIKLTGDSSVK